MKQIRSSPEGEEENGCDSASEADTNDLPQSHRTAPATHSLRLWCSWFFAQYQNQLSGLLTAAIFAEDESPAAAV